MAGWVDRILGRMSKSRQTEPDAKMSGVQVTSPRSAGDVTPYRTQNRDRPLEYTTAPPGARQQWQLHKIREESRDLELRSSIWGGYVRFVRIQAIGYELARLQFDRIEKADKERLRAVTRKIRSEWTRYQKIRGVGGTGQSVHQLAGSVLHHVIVDGDCFLVPRRGGERPARVGSASRRCARGVELQHRDRHPREQPARRCHRLLGDADRVRVRDRRQAQPAELGVL